MTRMMLHQINDVHECGKPLARLLAPSAANFITGQTLSVSGGYTVT